MLSERNKQDMLGEIFDKTKINVKCGQHFYFGPIKSRPDIKPVMNCPDCWKVFYIHELATTAPAERRAKLEEIEEVMNHMVEMIQAGTWDFEPYAHAQIEIGEE